jgi:hypothetical protein
MGTIERVLEPGRFVVALGSNSKIEVRGAGYLKTGTRVRLLLKDFSTGVLSKNSKTSFVEPQATSDIRWTALLPLGFGGKGSLARLEVFADRGGRDVFKKDNRAVYFVFTIATESQGEIQWYIHLKNTRISIQVYAKRLLENEEKLARLVRELETSLREHGFVISASTVFLRKPMSLPAATRLNLRG